MFKGFDEWYGADVVLATGWDTVYPVAMLPGCRARAYLVQDHEPEFFATSAESVCAERTYDHGLYPICASPWLRDLLADRYGATARTSSSASTTRSTGRARRRAAARHGDLLRPRRHRAPRRPARRARARGAVRRRPQTRFVLFGQEDALKAPFPNEDLGVASPAQLAWAYSEATVGLSLSLTNYSLIPQEMLACGLPCVELAGGSSESVFGADGPVELAAADPLALADALERLLDDEDHWREQSEAGVAYVADACWDRAAEQVEAGLREALRRAAAA